MSKGNMLLGYARGKMGDIVFARVKGQQVQRPRNRQPNNPRSAAQMYQRSLFACAVKFFSKGRQALFQYAFEGKKSTESDYNAFVRLNAKNGVHLTKDMIDNLNYPALGNWIMTQGSLPGFTSNYNETDHKFHSNLGGSFTADLSAITIGMLSQALIETGNFQTGDIITVLNIRSGSFYEEGSDPIPVVVDEQNPITWIIEQFEINPSSTELVTAIFNNFDFAKTSANALEITSRALSSSVDEIGGFAVFHSRKTSSGVKVSTTTLVNSLGANEAIAKCETQEYVDYVLVDWQSRQEAILEGALVKKN